MPRKPRIEIPGYYHIINRGVEQRDVFLSNKDFKTFEELLCKLSKEFDIILHNFCLMNKHYHLLIENKKENLSKFMRQLGMSYSIYFNKKYKRIGHLWQGRYKSWLITDEAYLYTLMRYIEQNPLKAGIVNNLINYHFSSFRYFINIAQIPKCLENSWINKNFGKNIDDIVDFLTAPVDKEDLKEIAKASSLVIASDIQEPKTKEQLLEIVSKYKDKKERNEKIVQAYKEGFSQHMIAKEIGLSQQAVSKIIKEKL